MHSPRLLVVLLLAFCAPLASASDIRQLVEQLDANQFSLRKAATDKLADKGVAAIPAIVQAARSDSREVAVRAHLILETHFEAGDAETKEAAKAALEQLAKGDGPTARRAQESLKPKLDPSQAGAIFAPGRIVINGQAGARIQIRQVAGNKRQIRIQQVNGAKRIRVQENGRKIDIQEDPNNGIKMEVTEKKDGKETTQKYAAKDAAELKKQHPDAYKVYEKHAKQNGGIQIRIAQGNAPGPRPAPVPAQNRKAQFDRMKKSFDERIKQYEQRAKQVEGHQKQAYERMIETFKRQRKMIEEMENAQRANPPAPILPAAPKQIDEIRQQLEKQQVEIRKQADAQRAELQKDIEAIADRIEQARRNAGR